MLEQNFRRRPQDDFKTQKPSRRLRVLCASALNLLSARLGGGSYALLAISLSVFALSLAFPAQAFQKKPKKALKESDARRAIASAPGFELKRGSVKVKEVSNAGELPVVVKADVEMAFVFEKVESESAEGSEAVERWRVEEFRVGDRSWERFDYLEGPLNTELVSSARRALEELAAEFEARRRERDLAKARKDEEESRARALEEDERGGDFEEANGGKDEKKKKKKDEKKDESKADENELEVRRGPLLMKEFSPMYESARAVVLVEGDFRLERDAKKKWRVVEFNIGDASVGEFDRLIAAVNRKKIERAREELNEIRRALEDFRRDRGFYVVAEDERTLIDHLAPRYLKSVIRIDPWHRPYRYEGSRQSYTLRSDGPDGEPSTSDDITISG